MTKKLNFDEDMAYIIGAILGDGYISNSTKSKTDLSKDYRIALETMDFSFVDTFYQKVTKFISTKTTIKVRAAKQNKVKTYYFQLRNKELYIYLTQTLNLPKGAKSTNLRVPQFIIFANKNLQKCFIAGLFDSDGGIRGRNIGFTMKNKDFMLDIQELLFKIDITSSKDSWWNKKYQRNYYGLRLNKENTIKFLNIISISNTEKLKRVLKHTNLFFVGN